MSHKLSLSLSLSLSVLGSSPVIAQELETPTAAAAGASSDQALSLVHRR